MPSSEDVLGYWFGAPLETEEQIDKRARWWFGGGPSVDAEIQERFGGLVAEAVAGKLDGWAETARGRLALIITLDQFTRNVFRGKAEAFATDPKAQRLTEEGLARGHYDALGSYFEKMFFALPFGHAEDVARQRRALALAEAAYLQAPAPLKKLAGVSVDQARKHFDVIARFGRFPHRNATMGRESTAEERAYLDYLRASGQQL
jgi:uncharacterized protein (DUF924 family)